MFNAATLFSRHKLMLFAIVIFVTGLIFVNEYYKGQVPPIRDTYKDDVIEEIYDKVLQRWYNLTGNNKWYNNENTSMFDEQLVREIRDKWIIQKWDFAVSYTLERGQVRDPSMGQAQAILDILENKRNGFFIEAGAYDGETRSNSLVLERYFGWSGILIEADPINFTKMLNKNRKAQMSPSCLSIKPHPMIASFLMAKNIGRIDDNSATNNRENDLDVAYTGQHVTVQCFPLASYIAALGIKTVDYFSLDVEGSEMQVLETIPFELVDIKTLSVEYIHNNTSRKYMINFMEKRGYYVYSFVVHPDNLANDVIFVKKEL